MYFGPKYQKNIFPGCHETPYELWELLAAHTACNLFWVPKRQVIYTDNGFISKTYILKSKYEREKNPTSPFRVISYLARPNQPFWLNQPGQLAGNSERAYIFLIYILISIYLFKYETTISRNCLSLGYSACIISSPIILILEDFQVQYNLTT